MATKAPLGAYLNDHLAGATAGSELTGRIAAQHRGTPLGAHMDELLAEIEADRLTLEQLIQGLGLERSSVREAAGWFAEKLSRLRFTEQVTRSADLTLLLELETLSLGVEGKLSMWQALKKAAEADAELAQTNFDPLIARAKRQLAGLEPHRLGAAARAFA